jgi:hypothetical protein
MHSISISIRIRTAFPAGAAIAATLLLALALSGCAVQRYHNPEACRQMMREQLAQLSQARLSLTHTAVSYQGRRVVVEGRLGRSAAASATKVLYSPDVTDATGTTGTTGTAGTDSLDAALAAITAAKPATPTTLVGSLLARLSSSHGPRNMEAAVECTFNGSRLATFRWLAPAQLARTTPGTWDNTQDDIQDNTGNDTQGNMQHNSQPAPAVH